MQFSNHYLQHIINTAVHVSGDCPPNFLVTSDVETAQRGDLFFVLQHTEHHFASLLSTLIKKEVAGIVINESIMHEYQTIATNLPISPDFFLLVVCNVESTLCKLADHTRQQKSHTVIAVTGIGGSRQGVEILAHIIKKASKPVVALYHEAEKNIVHQVATQIINQHQSETIIVFEAKGNKRHDIKSIAEALKPSYAIITSIGSHSIDTIGSLQDVAAEHRDIFAAFTEKNIGIVNGDQIALSSVAYPHPIVKFGLKLANQIQARKVLLRHSQTHFVLKMYRNKYPVTIPTTHADYVLATLAAIAMAKLLAIPDDIIVPTVQHPFVVSKCFEQTSLKEVTKGSIINDTYAADPESVKTALSAFHALETEQPKIAILGDMAGLGINSSFWHRQIGRFLKKVPSIESVLVIGKKGNYIKHTAPKTMFVEIVDSIEHLKEQLSLFRGKNPLILVKGVMPTEIQSFVSQLCGQ